MTYEYFKKKANMITKRIVFIICGITDVLAILIMIFGPTITLSKFIMGIFSLIGANYVTLKFTDFMLSL